MNLIYRWVHHQQKEFWKVSLCEIDENCTLRKGYEVECLNERSIIVETGINPNKNAWLETWEAVGGFFEITTERGVCYATPEKQDLLEYINKFFEDLDATKIMLIGAVSLGGIIIISRVSKRGGY